MNILELLFSGNGLSYEKRGNGLVRALKKKRKRFIIEFKFNI